MNGLRPQLRATAARVERRLSTLVRRGKRGVWSRKRYIGLRRDLTEPREPLVAPVQFDVRPLVASDVPALLDGPPSAPDAGERELRRRWVERKLRGCHVAAIKDGPACCMQWLLSAEDNEQISEFFGKRLPQLASDVVLLEGAYTPPAYRRVPILPAAMERIAALGRDKGARWAVVYIGDDNVSMIKAARWAGFTPFEEKVERRFLFGLGVRYQPLPVTE